MTLQQLRYLIKVAECASLGAAAGALHVSQPSLSIAIRNLEKELGRSLFERGPGGMTLTLDGLEFLGYARQLLQQVDAITHKYKGEDTEKSIFQFQRNTIHLLSMPLSFFHDNLKIHIMRLIIEKQQLPES